MPAADYDLQIEAGADFIRNLTFQDSEGAAINLTGYTFDLQIRDNYESEDAIISLTNGEGITITNAAAGQVKIQIAADDTATLSEKPLVYDLLGDSGTVKTRFLSGKVEVFPRVTIPE